MKKQSGMTILEVLITIVIISIVMLLAAPPMSNFIQDNRLATLSNDLVSSIRLARSEAISNRQTVIIEATGTKWHDGWRVYLDLDGSGDYAQANDTLLNSNDGFDYISDSSSATVLSFNNKGIRSSLAQWGPVTFCDSRGEGKKITITGMSSVDITTVGSSCAV
ncbi:MAG: GspH/FimT family pseudopilin [Kangiellaceae bacterium]|nr:GspH/FimT family pseudopilin [Kangiellaceae bacterium]